MVNYIKESAPRLTEDKSYIIGVLCGDACQKSNRYQIKLPYLAPLFIAGNIYYYVFISNTGGKKDEESTYHWY